MYFKMNNTAKMYIAGVSFLNLPQHILITTYEIMPSMIPAEIE